MKLLIYLFLCHAYLIATLKSEHRTVVRVVRDLSINKNKNPFLWLLVKQFKRLDQVAQTEFQTLLTALRKDVDAMIVQLNQSKGKCSPGWKSFSGHCYYFEHTKVSWEKAKTACEIKGAYLVKVDNAAENSWIATNIPNKFMWIGANDRNLEGSFTWVSDNSAVVFSKWYSGKPNDEYGKEDCASMDSKGFWNDGRCSLDLLSYICEK